MSRQYILQEKFHYSKCNDYRDTPKLIIHHGNSESIYYSKLCCFSNSDCSLYSYNGMIMYSMALYNGSIYGSVTVLWIYAADLVTGL